MQNIFANSTWTVRRYLPILLVAVLPQIAFSQGTKDPKIEIVNAVFGSGRGAARCAPQITRIIKNKNAVTTISTPGLGLRNPRGVFRAQLVITYKVDGKQGVLTLKNAQKVNIYKAIIEHAQKNAKPPTGKNKKGKGKSSGKANSKPKLDEVVIKLPAPFSKVRTGDHGKLLFFHVPDKDQIFVVDVIQRKIVKQMPVSDGVAFAANKTHLFLADPRTQQVQRFDLKTFRRDKSAMLDRDRLPQMALAGCNGNGPLAFVSKSQVYFWDSEKLEPLNLLGDTKLGGSSHYKYDAAVSADGQTFCGWTLGISSQPFHALRIQGNIGQANKTSGRNSGRWALPSPDGSHLFRNGNVTFSYDMKPVAQDDFKVSCLLPTEDPRFILAVKMVDEQHLSATICTGADLQPVHTLDLFRNNRKRRGWKSFWARVGGEPIVRYLPRHSRVVCMNEDQTQLTIRTIDLKKLLAQSQKQFLYVISKPKPTAEFGKLYSYKLQALSNSSRVDYKLDVGPPGMKIDRSGLVTWQVTSRPKDNVARVIINATTNDVQSFTHAFEIVVVDDPKTKVAANDNKSTKGKGTPRRNDIAKNKSQPPNNGLAKNKGMGKNKNRPPVKNAGKAGDAKGKVVAKSPERSSTFASKYKSFCAGGSGKFLIFHLPEKEVLAIFDVLKQNTVKEIKVPENVVYSANQNKLLIALPRLRQLQRWNLNTLKREAVATLDRDKAPTSAKMGSSGSGPLALFAGKELQFWNVDTMKRISLGSQKIESASAKLNYTVSADGKTFCYWPQMSGQRFRLIRFGEKTFQMTSSRDTHQRGQYWAIPNADGSLILRYGGKAYSRDLKPMDSVEFKDRVFIPTADPRYVFLLSQPSRNQTPVSLCSSVDFTEICRFDDVEALTDRSGMHWGRMNYTPRLHYLADQKLMVYLPVSNNKVVVRDLDIEAILRETGQPYLLANSKPKSSVLVGETFRYQIETLTSSKNLRFSLDSAPKGMSIRPNGLIDWPVRSRPIGGVVNVVVRIRGDGNLEYTHGFEVFVVRNRKMLTADLIKREQGEWVRNIKKESGFVNVSASQLEIPGRVTSVTTGLDRKTLLLAGNYFAVLNGDGCTVEKAALLDKVYTKITERKDHYVAISRNPKGVYVLDKKTLKVIKSQQLAYVDVMDLASHPTLPVSYVTVKANVEIPRYRFITFDEKRGSGRESKEWLGNWIAVDPSGQYLYTGFSDIYRSGSRLLMNPQRWDVVPEYGNLDWLVKYKLDKYGTPKFSQVKTEAGGNGKGIRLSGDGKRVSYLSHVGYPSGSRNLAGWDTHDFARIPTSYGTKDKASPQSLEFHPVLPLVASRGSGSAVFFDRESGKQEENRLAVKVDDLAGKKIDRIFFSPDGLNMVFVVDINDFHYLFQYPLKLSNGEKRRNKAGVVLPKLTVASTQVVSLASIDAFKGGKQKKMTTAEIAKAYAESVAVVLSGDSSGTAFVVGADGYILTCAHCIGDKSNITVRTKSSSGKLVTSKGILLAIDEDLDIALIKAGGGRKLKPIQLGVAHKIEMGGPVSVIGHPSDGIETLDYTMTQGIVSSPGRTIGDQKFIQTNATVNPGNSGGPMFDERGFVIGMVVLKARFIEGANFAIPANTLAEFIMKHLRKSEDSLKLEREWFNQKGDRSFKAQFISYKDGTVKLKRVSDGDVFELKLSELSEIDREFVKMLQPHVRKSK